MFAKQYNVANWEDSRQASSHIQRNLQNINLQNTAIFLSFSITNLFSKMTTGRFTTIRYYFHEVFFLEYMKKSVQTLHKENIFRPIYFW